MTEQTPGKKGQEHHQWAGKVAVYGTLALALAACGPIGDHLSRLQGALAQRLSPTDIVPSPTPLATDTVVDGQACRSPDTFPDHLFCAYVRPDGQGGVLILTPLSAVEEESFTSPDGGMEIVVFLFEQRHWLVLVKADDFTPVISSIGIPDRPEKVIDGGANQATSNEQLFQTAKGVYSFDTHTGEVKETAFHTLPRQSPAISERA